MSVTQEQLVDLVFAALRDAESGPEKVTFDSVDFERIGEGLRQVPAGQPLVDVLMALVNLAAFIENQMGSTQAAHQLLGLLETFAGPEVQKLAREELAATDKKVEAVAKRFDDFLGSKGEQLPDSGERLDPKSFKGPIRG